MWAYVISVAVATASIAVGNMFSYGGKNEKYAKGAVALALLAAVCAPVISAVSYVEDFDIDEYISDITPDTDGDLNSGYYEAVQDAFEIGIKKMICADFGLDDGGVDVFVFGFSPTEMRAENIKVILSGSAALADARLIKAALEDAKLGKCEVKLEFA